MHPVLGTMMPEICEAPHLPVSPFNHHTAPCLIVWDAFITFLIKRPSHPGHCLLSTERSYTNTGMLMNRIFL